MNRIQLFLKAAAVGLLTLLLLIPLGMINGTINERQAYRQQAIASVAASYAGPQTLLAPVVVLPYRVEVRSVRKDERGAPQEFVEVLDRQWVYFPRDTTLDAKLVPAKKHRGLHEVRVYELGGRMNGRFSIEVPTAVEDGTILSLGEPFLSLGISDVRGLVGAPQLSLDRRATPLQQGPGRGRGGNGLHATLAPLQAGEKRDIAFDLRLTLGGTEHFAFVPLADENHVRLQSSWQHPNFDGQYSPRSPSIGATGFDASWDISALASGVQAQYLSGASGDAGTSEVPEAVAMQEGRAPGTLESLSVTLSEPVNLYSQADRASKYGILFIALTFVGFFMFELIKRLAIHPIQYALVGLALAIFFLLLLSLSEHIPFAWAYVSASTACIGLLGIYLSAVLRSAARAFGFAGMLTLLYGALYGLLVSEDNALVLGSLMLFAILAAIMIVTRRIDWYALSASGPPPIPERTAASEA